MRIVLLNDRIPPEGRGGAESVVWRLAQGLQSVGHDVHVIATTPNIAFDEVRDGIPTSHIHANFPDRWRAWLSLYNPQTINALRAKLQQIQPHVINAHNIHFYLSYHSLKVARDLNIPTVFSSHDVMPFAYTKLTHFIKPDIAQMTLPQDYRIPRGFNLKQNRFRYNPWRNRMIRHYLTRYAQIRTTPSQALAEAHHANDLPPFDVVHNGINVDEWANVDPQIVQQLTDQLGLQHKKVILIAGRLTSHKGTYQLLAAMSRLVDRMPDMRLLVLTASPLDKQIPPEFEHLKPYIVSGGWLDGEALIAAYHIARVVVTPSVIFDTFPTVNLEAMAAGIPVIATVFGGSCEVVVDGQTGYIVNPYDTDIFAEHLHRLLTDDALHNAMGDAGQRRIREYFTLAHQIQQMVMYYQRAIDMS
jgi:glycosyltransferase involved in cell wall biosynthesis